MDVSKKTIEFWRNMLEQRGYTGTFEYERTDDPDIEDDQILLDDGFHIQIEVFGDELVLWRELNSGNLQMLAADRSPIKIFTRFLREFNRPPTLD